MRDPWLDSSDGGSRNKKERWPKQAPRSTERRVRTRSDLRADFRVFSLTKLIDSLSSRSCQESEGLISLPRSSDGGKTSRKGKWFDFGPSTLATFLLLRFPQNCPGLLSLPPSFPFPFPLKMASYLGFHNTTLPHDLSGSSSLYSSVNFDDLNWAEQKWGQFELPSFLPSIQPQIELILVSFLQLSGTCSSGTPFSLLESCRS